MRRLPFNNLILVLITQLIIIAVVLLLPQNYIADFDISLMLCLASLSLLMGLLLGLRGVFLLLTLAITIGSIFIIYFPNLIPSWFLFAGFLILASLHLPAVWTHVPYYPTPNEIDETLLTLIPSKSINDNLLTFADLGCGTGRLLYKLAQQRPDVQFYGVELSILPYLLAKFRSYLLPNLTIELRSFWKIDLSLFDVVYTFLSPAPMPRIGQQISKELKPGAMLVSNSFQIPKEFINNFDEQKVTISDSLKGGTLFVYSRKY